MSDPIYLDHNATAPLDPEVAEAMRPYLGSVFGNSRSGHLHGRRIKEAIERARGEVAALLGCEADEVVFTSGGSEANNLALKGLAWAHPQRRHLVHSALEHYSVSGACAFLERQGWSRTVVPVDGDGRLDLAAFERALSADTLVVSIQHANNEIGTNQDVPAIAERARKAGAVFHCDAAQSVGKVPVDVRVLGVDLLTVAPHKFGGPAGVGALFRKRGVTLEPLIHGAGHEDGLRSGTHGAALIVGFGKAAALTRTRLSEDEARLRALRDRLHAGLAAEIPGLQLNGHPALRLPHTLNVSFPGLEAPTLLAHLPGVSATTGAACHSGRREPSLALQAIGASLERGLGAVRFSLGRTTSAEEIDEAVRRLVAAVRSLRI